jgi:transposase InsO family protein
MHKNLMSRDAKRGNVIARYYLLVEVLPESGRIERIEQFFGTLKNVISTALIPTMSVHAQLQWFRNYYNHVRPHQHLRNRTPMEAWQGIERQCGDALADFWEARFYRPA